MKGYKAFRQGLICDPTGDKPFQYKENTIFQQEGELAICENGFHFCKKPLDVFNYYPFIYIEDFPEFAEVEALDECYPKTANAKKYCTNKIKIGNKITFCDLIEQSIKKFPDKSTDELIVTGSFNDIKSEKDNANIAFKANISRLISESLDSNIGISGSYNKIYSQGAFSRISLEVTSENNRLTVVGQDTRIASRGNCNQINIFADYVKLVSDGVGTLINSSGKGVKIVSKGASDKINASGEGLHVTSTGDNVIITAQGEHNVIDSQGKNAIICCFGPSSYISAKKGSQIAFFNYDIDTENSNSLITAYVDGEKIKEDTFCCVSNGKIISLDLNKFLI